MIAADSRAVRLGKRLLVALLVVFLHFSGEVAAMLNVRNRYFLHWGWVDTASLATAIAGLALAITGASLVANRSRIGRRILRVAFVIAFASGILVFARVHLLPERPRDLLAVTVLCTAAAAFTVVRPRTRLVGLAFQACLILSPLTFVTLADLSWKKAWSCPPEPLRETKLAREGAPPIYVFILDEWSYQRSTTDGELNASLPRLRELGHQSLFFQDAISPAANTFRSLPMLLYSSRDYEHLPLVFLPGGRGKDRIVEMDDIPAEGRISAVGPAQSSLFDLAAGQGYNTSLLGFYLPYRRMFRSGLDCCRTYPYYPTGRTFLEKIGLRTLEVLRAEPDPVSRQAFRTLLASVYSPFWRQLNEVLETDALDLIRKGASNTFGFLHLPVPHAPYIFDADGSYLGVHPVGTLGASNDDEDRMFGKPESYERHLAYMDRLVGRFIDAMREAGKFDDALIILTSDHSWRNERSPAFRQAEDAVRWVPLVVKLPGQRAGVVIETRFEILRIREIIEQVLRHGRVGVPEILNALGISAHGG
jgi:hypothetical protein